MWLINNETKQNVNEVKGNENECKCKYDAMKWKYLNIYVAKMKCYNINFFALLI